MRYVIRWWETLGRPERIVAISVTAGSIVAITNSTVWAIAASYMSHQKAMVAVAQTRAGIVAGERERDPHATPDQDSYASTAPAHADLLAR